MRSDLRIFMRKRQGGQTLIIAMIVLGVLLLLGFVFIGMVRGNILNTGRSRLRSVANDLAEAGIRYAHAQLVSSELGADWRGTPTAISTPNGQPNFTLDPDIYYLRPAARAGQNPVPFRVGRPQVDLGGPDGLGPYIRFNNATGRSLVRVRYAPSDANILSDSPTGVLRSPGAVRSYLIIESIGREGKVSLNDPTTLSGADPVQFQGFGSSAALQAGLGKMRQFDSQFANSRKLIAFASIGIIDHALYVTNVDNVTRPIEIGYPDDLGASYVDSASGSVDPIQVVPKLTMQIGTPGNIKSPTTDMHMSGGSMYFNGDVLWHGKVRVFLNSTLGERIAASGVMASASTQSSVSITESFLNSSTGQWDFTDQGAVPSLDSRASGFSTVHSLFQDGIAAMDGNGFPRGIGKKIAPSISAVDPSTKSNRYLLLTRETGPVVGGGRAGRFGHGEGVYVDNISNMQYAIGSDDPLDALLYDWQNPGNGGSKTAWQGSYYIPTGAMVNLDPEGFTIQRDGSSKEPTWKAPDGSDTGQGLIRYKIGMVSPGGSAPSRLFIINSFTPGVDINGNLTPSDFLKGQPFNGVLYFEGNVRVRGVIPTDVQLSLVSNGTIYIEGSIVKGVIGNYVTGTSGRLDHPTKSQLMLMAAQHVAVNTTMFTAPNGDSKFSPYSDNSVSAKYNPIQMPATDGHITLDAEFPLDWENASDPSSPKTWEPYALHYVESGNPNNRLSPELMLTHTMSDGSGAASLFDLRINEGRPTNPTYNFSVFTNTASSYLVPPVGTTFIPMYGLGADQWQRYNQFESRGFSLIDPVNSTVVDDVITMNGNAGKYQLTAEGPNALSITPDHIAGAPSNDYLLARSAVAPDDVRIEASVFAEKGSFFVIAGPWFNNNPDDTRVAYALKLQSFGGASSVTARDQADQDRMERCGVVYEVDSSGHSLGSIVPFYGEPQDVRVTLVGSIAENMPPPMSVQADSLRKWGWIPGRLGSTTSNIPASHVPAGYTNPSLIVVPNLNIQYDPTLATGRTRGWTDTNNPNDLGSPLVRADDYGRALPPMPRLPVSPALAYFGEVQ